MFSYNLIRLQQFRPLLVRI
ncbi:hypothetical protein LINGRAHAP2_LOCUS26742 [Linum grandiflorum]